MSNTITVRVGQMPGQIREFAVAEGSTVRELLSLANLNASGKEIKIDGATGSVDSKITSTTSLVLLTAQIKGNAEVKTVRVGKMPGQIREFAVAVGSTVKELLALANLSASGQEIKVDGATASLDTKITSSTSLVLLTAQIKGNSEVKTVRVGKMPGQINEYAVSVGSTVKELLALANLSASGQEIKVDGATASLDTKITSSTSLVLLTAQIKGNK